MRLPDSNDLQATAFLDNKTFDAASWPVLTNRTVGRLTLQQRVPSTSIGGQAQWSRTFGGRHAVTAGGDVRWVDGGNVETRSTCCRDHHDVAPRVGRHAAQHRRVRAGRHQRERQADGDAQRAR